MSTAGASSVARRRQRRTAPAALLQLDEPLALLTALRADAAVDPVATRLGAPGRLAGVAWESWRSRLEKSGVQLDGVEVAFSGAEWEIWLWVNGDRIWSQLAPLLAGRVARRASALGK